LPVGPSIALTKDKKMKTKTVKYLCGQIIFVLLIIQSFAQTSNNLVSDPQTGLQFSIPDGWSGQEMEAGYLLGSNTIKGFILITYHQYTSLQQIKSEASQGIVDQNGTALYLEGAIEKLRDNCVGATFSGTVEWQQAKAYVASLISPTGKGGISILAAVETAAFSKKYKQYVKSIVNSVTYTKPKAVPQNTQWKEKLNDSRLTYMNSYNSGYGGGGYQDKTIIDLCSAGYFRYDDHSETVINAGDYAGGYSTGSAAGSGQWKVINRGNQAILQLVYNDGSSSEYTLTEDEGKTFLNGDRYFRTYRNSAVESGIPNCW
jgi:hypothetical protein